MKNQYYSYIKENIFPSIQDIETLRKKKLRKVVFVSLIFFLLGGIFAFCALFLMFNNFFKLILFPIALFLTYYFFIKSIIYIICENKKYQALLLNDLIPKLLVPIANFKSWPKNNNTEAILESSLFHNFDTQEDETSLFGVYDNINIILSRTRLKMPVKGVNKPNLFKGIIIQIELNKSINNHLIMISKNEKKYNNFKMIKTGFDVFEKYLYVFAKNSQNMLFMNENFWNVIKKMCELYSAKSFKFSYNNNNVVIALKQKKFIYFGSLFKSLYVLKNYDEFLDKFIVIYNLVDILNQY